jgi:hypothetical protein
VAMIGGLFVVTVGERRRASRRAADGAPNGGRIGASLVV